MKSGRPNRSEFIRQHLSQNPGAKLADVNQAWKKAGNSGSLTPTLFYQVKSKAGFAKRRRGRRPGRPAGRPTGRGPGRPPRVMQAGGSDYAAIEESLDALIATATNLGDVRLASDLRAARRHASAKLV